MNGLSDEFTPRTRNTRGRRERNNGDGEETTAKPPGRPASRPRTVASVDVSTGPGIRGLAAAAVLSRRFLDADTQSTQLGLNPSRFWVQHLFCLFFSSFSSSPSSSTAALRRHRQTRVIAWWITRKARRRGDAVSMALGERN